MLVRRRRCIRRYLEENEVVIRALVEASEGVAAATAAAALREGLQMVLEENAEEEDVQGGQVDWVQQLCRIWAFGPHRVGKDLNRSPFITAADEIAP